MAIFFMRVRSVSRAAGRSGSHAPSAAAYRAGERIHDERTGRVHDHRARTDVLYKEIVLPSAVAGAGRELDWARSRDTLWNAAERAERQRNARVAREYILGLPHELAPAARRDLARGFARELADRFGAAVDLVMHAPRTDARNFHAHLLATTRVATPTGLGAKTSFEWSDTQRRRHGLARWRDELAGLRERWAVLSNEALRQAGLQARVSHHPDPDAGLRRGRAWLPRIAYEIEKRGGHSVLGDLVRQRYAVRMEARRQELALREFAIGSAAPEATRDVARDVAHNVAPDAARDMARALESGARPAPGRPRTLEEIRARALVEWQALRRQARETHQAAARHGWGASPQQQRDAGDERARERGRDSGYEHEL